MEEALEEIEEGEYNDVAGPAGMLTYGEYANVCDKDGRVKIENTEQIPYRMICKLYKVASNGKRYIGSGFFISPRCVITSGHVVHSKGGWAKSVTVIPGMNGSVAPFGRQTSSLFFSVKGWTEKKKMGYDHGAIILPDETLFNSVRGFFGYREESGRPFLNNSGYPGDKSPSTHQWFNAGRATDESTDLMFKYMIDTAGGQSGCPVWVEDGDTPVAVGVHGYGGCPNSCVRAQGYVLNRWSEWQTK